MLGIVSTPHITLLASSVRHMVYGSDSVHVRIQAILRLHTHACFLRKKQEKCVRHLHTVSFNNFWLVSISVAPHNYDKVGKVGFYH